MLDTAAEDAGVDLAKDGAELATMMEVEEEDLEDL